MMMMRICEMLMTSFEHPMNNQKLHEQLNMNLKMRRTTKMKAILMTCFEHLMNNCKHEGGGGILMTSLEHLRNDGTLSQQERSLLFNDLSSKKGKVFTLS